jgi:UDP-N-acetylmuramate--alanine ligase
MYNINLEAVQKVYFIGIGGIGMSALARYFHEIGKQVSGYDKTPTTLTNALQAEGITIHFEDNINLADTDADIIVYTPAIPHNHSELNWFRTQGKTVVKRSDILEIISKDMFAITIAGTHGKTTVSSMVAHILRDSQYGWYCRQLQ